MSHGVARPFCSPHRAQCHLCRDTFATRQSHGGARGTAEAIARRTPQGDVDAGATARVVITGEAGAAYVYLRRGASGTGVEAGESAQRREEVHRTAEASMETFSEVELVSGRRSEDPAEAPGELRAARS